MTSAGASLTGLGGEAYVRLTTFKRDGTAVGSAVWVAPDEDVSGVLWVTTTASTGKVKRLRHTRRVVLAPCDRRGRVAPGAPEVEAVGEVLTDPATLAAVQRRIQRKYRVAAAATRVVFGAAGSLRRLRGKPPRPGAALRLSAPAS
jgi:PPOX class probable F420-dependent enzyme